MSVADFIEDVLVRHHRAWVPVVEAGGQLVGGAGVEEARAVPAAERASTPLRRIALPVRESERIEAPLRASGAFARMQHDHLARLYVVKDGQLAGVVSLSRPDGIRPHAPPVRRRCRALTGSAGNRFRVMERQP